MVRHTQSEVLPRAVRPSFSSSCTRTRTRARRPLKTLSPLSSSSPTLLRPSRFIATRETRTSIMMQTKKVVVSRRCVRPASRSTAASASWAQRAAPLGVCILITRRIRPTPAGALHAGGDESTGRMQYWTHIHTTRRPGGPHLCTHIINITHGSATLCSLCSWAVGGGEKGVRLRGDRIKAAGGGMPRTGARRWASVCYTERYVGSWRGVWRRGAR